MNKVQNSYIKSFKFYISQIQSGFFHMTFKLKIWWIWKLLGLPPWFRVCQFFSALNAVEHIINWHCGSRNQVSTPLIAKLTKGHDVEQVLPTSHPHNPFISVRLILTLSSHLLLSSKWHFPRDFHIKVLYVFLVSPNTDFQIHYPKSTTW